jgi:hypothetical protein
MMILLQESYELHLKAITKKSSKKKSKKEKTEPLFEPFDWTKGDPFEEVVLFVSCHDPRSLELFNQIAKYAANHKKFNIEFVDSVWDYNKRKGYITPAQFNSLVKLYYAYEMEMEE